MTHRTTLASGDEIPAESLDPQTRRAPLASVASAAVNGVGSLGLPRGFDTKKRPS